MINCIHNECLQIIQINKIFHSKTYHTQIKLINDTNHANYTFVTKSYVNCNKYFGTENNLFSVLVTIGAVFYGVLYIIEETSKIVHDTSNLPRKSLLETEKYIDCQKDQDVNVVYIVASFMMSNAY